MAEEFVRVCFAFYGEDKLEEGVRLLGETMRRIFEMGKVEGE
jgi:DNA-binding transcriptional MocR family regulator